MEDRIKKVMSAVFEVPIKEINDKSSPDTIESWDSLKHMNLVVALEEEFDVHFNDEDIVEIMNYSLIKIILSKRIEELISNKKEA